MKCTRAAFKPSPSRGGLGGDGVAVAVAIRAPIVVFLADHCANTIPTQTLPLKGRTSERRALGVAA